MPVVLVMKSSLARRIPSLTIEYPPSGLSPSGDLVNNFVLEASVHSYIMTMYGDGGVAARALATPSDIQKKL